MSLHVPLVSVQRRVIDRSVGTLVTVVVGELAAVITAVPEAPSKLHTPVPTLDTAASVNVLLLHNVLSAPAAASGCSSFLITTSSKSPHVPLVSVQRRV